MASVSLFYQSIERSLKRLNPLNQKIKNAKNEDERLTILDQDPDVNDFLDKQPLLKNFVYSRNSHDQYIFKSLLAIGQGPIIFQDLEHQKNLSQALEHILTQLQPVEKFYNRVGGIIGYHVIMLELILEKELGDACNKALDCEESYFKPPGYDLTQDTSFTRNAVRAFLERMPTLVEIYPVGGAGDRLKLKDEKTHEDLPVAELIYEGKTLLEGILRDLQAREYLHYKLIGKQICIPVAMMTSDEKNNDNHIRHICERNNWFGRPKNSYNFFKQPLVPVLTEQGNWAVSEPLKIFFKPGGHGVLWKLLVDSGILDQFLQKGYRKALLRQINNPAASTDFGLLAFCGCGFLSNQLFGFASCQRLLNTAEGMDVLIEKNKANEYQYCISNVEYTEFVKKQMKDVPEKQGSSFSSFPANTNILFADLNAIKEVIDQCPMPGLLINMKIKFICYNSEGKKEEMFVGRLESLMQNIAELFVNSFSQPQKNIKPESLHTYLTYNSRQKTISVTKKLHIKGQPLEETPDGCYLNQLINHYELFTKHCNMKLPPVVSEEEYMQKGPSFITAFHPALGPLFSIIGQKIQEGSLNDGSEMVLEIAEVDFLRIDISGSLLVFAENVMGHRDNEGLLKFSENVGRCILRNVKIINQGIDRTQKHFYWKGKIARKEALSITLKGRSEFRAENCIFNGCYNIEVPDGHRMTAKNEKGKIVFDLEPLPSVSESWNYSFDNSNRICLEKTLR